jgi:hypothetical protein
MMIDHEMLDTCAPALVCDYLYSAQIEADPQGLALRQATSIFTAKIGSGTSNKLRHGTRLRRGLGSRPAGFWPAALGRRRIIAANIP